METMNNTLVNKTFNNWTVLEELEHSKLRCRCSCGTEKICNKHHVLSGASKSCGCLATENKKKLKTDTTNQTFNDWTVLKELGGGKVLCSCSCGKEKVCIKNSITSGKSKSCGHKLEFRDLTGQKINEWTILEELGHGRVKCQCSCGKIVDNLQKPFILNGASKSCGCKKSELAEKTLLSRYGERSTNKVENPRERWQIDAVSNKESMIKFIEDTYKVRKPTIKDLVKKLGINEATVGRKIKELGVQDYVNIKPLTSIYEEEIADYIRSLDSNLQIIRNNRTILEGKEIDIYIPEKKLAIEFNGNYWHSDWKTDKYYHRDKTINCAKQGIRLIHIFEYEWRKKLTQNIIKDILKRSLTGVDNKLNSKDTIINPIDNLVMIEALLEASSLEGYKPLDIALGCYNKEDNELLGIMTFKKLEDSNEYEYKLTQLCWKSNTEVAGGNQKLLQYFQDHYNPTSIITYVNISKFTGNSYTELGFKVGEFTEPEYLWASLEENITIPQNEVTEQKLLEYYPEIQIQDQIDEEELIEDLGYVKIYNSGNLKLTLQTTIRGNTTI